MEAALKSFWRKGPLRRYLIRMGVPAAMVAAVPESMTKRDLLTEVIPQLPEKVAVANAK
jgi:hypothetical protein